MEAKDLAEILAANALAASVFAPLTPEAIQKRLEELAEVGEETAARRSIGQVVETSVTIDLGPRVNLVCRARDETQFLCGYQGSGTQASMISADGVSLRYADIDENGLRVNVGF